MASEVEVCNLALANIRAASINDLNESSLQAQICKLKYPFCRDFMLENAPWNFAHRLKPLSVLTDEIFNWAYVYQYPSDCLRINHLVLNFQEVEQQQPGFRSRFYDPLFPKPDLSKQVKYQVYNIGTGTSGNKVIAANETELRIDYRAKIEDPNKFSFEFIMALSHFLAAEIAIPIVGGEMGRQFRSDSIQLYQEYIDAAMQSDLNESYTEPTDSELVTTR